MKSLFRRFLTIIFRNRFFTLTRSRNVIPSFRLAQSRIELLGLYEVQLVLDIGANRGQWALEVIRNGFSKSLISFEPITRAFNELRDNSNSHRNWKAHNLAIGAMDESKLINVAGNNELSSSFLEMENAHLQAAPDSQYIREELVEVSNINNWLNPSQKTYLKIDTQGYEMEILKSIEDDKWSSICTLEIETSVIKTYDQPYLIEDVILFLRSKGYQPYRFENGLAAKPFGQQLQIDIIFVNKFQRLCEL